ncbi:glycosyltransferase EpsE [Virgibacillus siamensis]|uniref:Glycosyltransferase EpsE n=1 Tax=Virgibacillus siamensis TaxID=480071 RepID=A0ABN1G8P8_9BACI
MPRLSVIMGIYNTNNEKKLKDSIGSILNQTFTDFEFIICDDGSTDGTFDLITKITEQDDRVKILRSQTNKGLAKALNTCIEIATGEYIARMDADDISTLDRFEKQIDFLDNNPEYALVGSSIILFDEKGDWGRRQMMKLPNTESFLFGPPFIHPSIIIRKSAILTLNGYRVDKETLRCEDYELFMRLYSMNMKGYNIQESLLKIRENHEAFSRRKYKYRFDEAKVRAKGFKSLGLLPKGWPYVLKPLIVGLIPQRVLKAIKNESIK